jgi:hypothetical protein
MRRRAGKAVAVSNIDRHRQPSRGVGTPIAECVMFGEIREREIMEWRRTRLRGKYERQDGKAQARMVERSAKRFSLRRYWELKS